MPGARSSGRRQLFTADEMAELRDLLGRAVDRAVLPESAWAHTEEPDE